MVHAAPPGHTPLRGLQPPSRINMQITGYSEYPPSPQPVMMQPPRQLYHPNSPPLHPFTPTHKSI